MNWPRSQLFDFAIKALVVLVVSLACVLAEGCTRVPSAAPATYGAELEVCLQTTSTCPGYLACRHRVQARYGRPLTGTCLP